MIHMSTIGMGFFMYCNIVALCIIACAIGRFFCVHFLYHLYSRMEYMMPGNVKLIVVFTICAMDVLMFSGSREIAGIGLVITTLMCVVIGIFAILMFSVPAYRNVVRYFEKLHQKIRHDKGM